MKPDADILIAGAGLSGLSLATHLVETGPSGLRIVLVDPRSAFGRDRTWCMWDVLGHPFRRTISARWPRWTVRGSTTEVTRGAWQAPYVHIPADAFYRDALARLQASGRVELCLGTGVERIEDRGALALTETSAGPLSSRLVFDSRPRKPALDRADDVLLLQQFEGWEVSAEPGTFDAARAVLMDFDVDPSRGVHFVYVLPFTSSRALVEATWFTGEPVETSTSSAAVRSYLARRYGITEPTVLHRERGTIPMTTARMPRRPAPRIVRIGLSGGLARPSTGYAFLAIQQDSARIARMLRRGALPAGDLHPRSARTEFLDRVFLSLLQRRPELAPRIFTALFESVDPLSLVRFLSDVGGWRDALRVVAGSPAWPLATEALRVQVVRGRDI